MEPIISIIVPVYNAAPYLDRCLQSLLDQTYQALQIVLVDDGSTDRSLSICQAYQRRDRRVDLIVQPNGGISQARNTGLRHARGEFLMFVDADDYVAPSFCQLALAAARQHQADIVMFDFWYVENGSPEQRHVLEHGGEVDKEVAMTTTVEYSFAFNKLYKWDLFDDLSFPPHQNYEDVWIMYRLMAKANRVYYLPVATYYYTQRSNSISNSFTLANERDLLRAQLSRYRFFKQQHYPAAVSEMLPSLVVVSFFYLALDDQRQDPALRATAQQIFVTNRIPTSNISGRLYLAMVAYRLFPNLVARWVRQFYAMRGEK